MIEATIFGDSLGMSKPRQKFLQLFFHTLFIMRGKVNFTNLARYSGASEKYFRRHCRKGLDWVRMNLGMIGIVDIGESIAAIDASAFRKAGKRTFGLGWFWSGTANRAIRGLEVSCICIVSMKYWTAFTLSMVQTDGKVKDKSRMDAYIRQLKSCKDALRSRVKYIAGDGFYSKRGFVDAVKSCGLEFIGRLRDDANMNYLATPQNKPTRGRKRLYAGKFTGADNRRWKFVCMLEYDNRSMELRTAELYHKSLGQVIRVAMLLDSQTKKHVLLFSTDRNLDAETLHRYYSSRFQIEFLFRDAKQHLGLEDCMSRNRKCLDFHFNSVMAGLNIIKVCLYKDGKLAPEIPISIADFKSEATNRFLLDRIIEKLGLCRDFVENHPAYPELINFGRIAA